MPVKSIADQGYALKLGRLRPTERPKLRCSRYMKAGLPTPPPVIHWTGPADSSTSLFNILANDELGDCTSAGAGHILDIFRAWNGSRASSVTRQQAIDFYSKSTGYVPSDPSTDQGGDEITVLNCWRDKGYFADGSGKIAGYVGVDAANVEQCKAAIWLFGNLYFGVELPDAWLRPAPRGNGFTWDVAGEPDPHNGHCFIAGAYNSNGAIIDTWGMIGTLTWAGVAKYASPPNGELYAILSEDWIDQGERQGAERVRLSDPSGGPGGAVMDNNWFTESIQDTFAFLGALIVLALTVCFLLALSGCATMPIRQCDRVPFFEAGCW
jgi:hypothetical protein